MRTQYNMTPEQYREKWGLSVDYPMVAPNYAAARSQLAKQMGLGQQRRRRAKKREILKVVDISSLLFLRGLHFFALI